MSGCSRTVLRVYIVSASLLILAGNLISAFVMFRIPNALLESFPGAECVEGPCKGFSGSTEEEFQLPSSAQSASASLVIARQARWGPDVGWLLNVVALGLSSAAPPSKQTLCHPNIQIFHLPQPLHFRLFFFQFLKPLRTNPFIFPNRNTLHYLTHDKSCIFISNIKHNIVSNITHNIISNTKHSIISNTKHNIISNTKHNIISNTKHNIISNTKHNRIVCSNTVLFSSFNYLIRSCFVCSLAPSIAAATAALYAGSPDRFVSFLKSFSVHV
jgi:hypothetical protein